MATQEEIELLIQILEHARKRPGMYFSETLPPISNFLNGFNINQVKPDLQDKFQQCYKELVIEHGWEWGSLAPLGEMREKGMTNDEIAQEMLTIQIETWQRLLENWDRE